MGDGAKWVCANCGLPCGHWHFGWKHHSGGAMKGRSCGRVPVPVKRELYEKQHQQPTKGEKR